MKVTVNKIAELANVSRGTVDRVLHDRPGVKTEVRKRILEIINTLDYTPNLAGKALVCQNKNIFFSVILAPDFHPFVEEIRKGVQAQADEIKGFGVKVEIDVIKTLDASEQLQILDKLEQKGVSGISICPILEKSISKRIDELVDKGIPVITFNSDLKDSKRLCFVGQDNEKAGRTAFGLMNLILPSNSKVAILTSSQGLDCHVHRIGGFISALASSFSGIQLVGISENKDRDDLAFDEVIQFCKKYPDLEGIYLTGGGAGGLGNALKVCNMEKQVKVVTHDLVPPVLTLMNEGIIKFTIGQNPFTQGNLPIKLLFDYVFKKIKPEKKNFYTNIDIKIAESL